MARGQFIGHLTGESDNERDDIKTGCRRTAIEPGRHPVPGREFRVVRKRPGGRARTVNPPAEARHLAIDDPDYSYACQRLINGNAGRPAEEWARKIFEDAPKPLRSVIVAGWIAVLRLRLARPLSSSAHILGWEIISATPASAVLGVSSPGLTARLVVQVEGAAVTHSTFLRYERPSGKALWALAAPVHRTVIPYLLNRAVIRWQAQHPG